MIFITSLFLFTLTPFNIPKNETNLETIHI